MSRRGNVGFPLRSNAHASFETAASRPPQDDEFSLAAKKSVFILRRGGKAASRRTHARRFSRETVMPQTIRAIVVDTAASGRLAIKPVELRDPDRDEVAVRVTAISLNRDEPRR